MRRKPKQIAYVLHTLLEDGHQVSSITGVAATRSTLRLSVLLLLLRLTVLLLLGLAVLLLLGLTILLLLRLSVLTLLLRLTILLSRRRTRGRSELALTSGLSECTGGSTRGRGVVRRCTTRSGTGVCASL